LYGLTEHIINECMNGICVAEDIDGVGDEGSGDVTTVDVQSLREAFF
jgi:hypothetical protein